jgi:hypothetical protein
MLLVQVSQLRHPCGRTSPESAWAHKDGAIDGRQFERDNFEPQQRDDSASCSKDNKRLSFGFLYRSVCMECE